VDVELAPYLEAVGFHVEFALRTGVDVRSDTKILRWARRRKYIFVCHDKHKDKSTRLELYPEIYRNGGRIIQIGGLTGQPLLTAFGKIVGNREEWSKFFAENDGVVTVGMHNLKTYNREQLQRWIQGIMNVGPAVGGKAKQRRPRPRKPRQRRPEQRPFDDM
jgi:hypothetical protein